jgi:hypothetical protein
VVSYLPLRARGEEVTRQGRSRNRGTACRDGAALASPSPAGDRRAGKPHLHRRGPFCPCPVRRLACGVRRVIRHIGRGTEPPGDTPGSRGQLECCLRTAGGLARGHDRDGPGPCRQRPGRRSLAGSAGDLGAPKACAVSPAVRPGRTPQDHISPGDGLWGWRTPRPGATPSGGGSAGAVLTGGAARQESGGPAHRCHRRRPPGGRALTGRWGEDLPRRRRRRPGI